MKVLVETTGSFMLMSNGQEVQNNRPSVIVNSDFFQSRVANGQLKVLGQLQDTATDAEFAAFWVESKQDNALAAASFISKFGIPPVTAKDAEKPAPAAPAAEPVAAPAAPVAPAPAKDAASKK